jgi:hypothetical protein
MRRLFLVALAPSFSGRMNRALAISLVPIAMIVLATELPGLTDGLATLSLTGSQWLACIGLALLLPLVIEVSKWVRRVRTPSKASVGAQVLVPPGRRTPGGHSLTGRRPVTAHRPA